MRVCVYNIVYQATWGEGGALVRYSTKLHIYTAIHDVCVCMHGRGTRQRRCVSSDLSIIQMYEMLRSLSEEVRFNQTIS